MRVGDWRVHSKNIKRPSKDTSWEEGTEECTVRTSRDPAKTHHESRGPKSPQETCNSPFSKGRAWNTLHILKPRINEIITQEQLRADPTRPNYRSQEVLFNNSRTSGLFWCSNPSSLWTRSLLILCNLDRYYGPWIDPLTPDGRLFFICICICILIHNI